MIFLKYQKLTDTAQTPSKTYKSDAAYDLYASEAMVIPPGEVAAISTGLKLDIPEGYEVEIFSRSGLASKGIFVANQPGTIDAGYTGEIKILMYNSTPDDYNIEPGHRVAQLKVRQVLSTKLIEVDSIKVKDRGESGIGSTGR